MNGGETEGPVMEYLLELTDDHRRSLLELARMAIAAQFDETIPAPSCPDDALSTPHGAFVTLTITGSLRGCIGRIEATTPLWDIVTEMAHAAAFQDPRFPRVTQDELELVDIDISILSPLEPVDDPSDIVIGTHGLLIRKDLFSGLLLPQVASSRNWDVTTFLRETCRKAGLGPNEWQDDDAELFLFSAEVFSDKETYE